MSRESRPKPPFEARRHPRAEVAATAHVVAGTRSVGPFIVENLSAGGALLRGPSDLRVGEGIKVILNLIGIRPLSVRATIVRVEEGGVAFAIAFRGLPSWVEDKIHERVLKSLELERSLNVLIVDDTPATSRVLEAQIHALGHRTASSRTPLEAIVMLQDANGGFDVAVIDRQLRVGCGVALLAFVREQYPRIYRVLMSCDGDPDRAEQLPESVSVNDLLREPWSMKTLEAILQRATPGRRQEARSAAGNRASKRPPDVRKE